MFNLKTLSLELYNQEVIVTLKPGSESFKRYGKSITGYLVGRIWGERFDKATKDSTVIGITLRISGNDEVNFPSNDIDNLERSTYLA